MKKLVDGKLSPMSPKEEKAWVKSLKDEQQVIDKAVERALAKKRQDLRAEILAMREEGLI